MRVAALYDIHGNLPALEAVLREIRAAAVDHVVIGGDVLPGPMPRETLACLLNLDIPVQFIHGNGDRVVLAQIRGKDISEVPEQFREVIRWTAQQLDPAHERVLARWRLIPVFAGVNVPVVVCGHTHMQFDRMVGEVRVVNAGSVGMPFAQPPGAYWALLGPDVRLQHTVYDFANAAARIRETDYPQAEELAVRYILQPPLESESLELLSHAELR